MPRREFEGIVVSDKSDKTVVVKVESMEMNPIYKKFLKRTRKFAAHDETNKFKERNLYNYNLKLIKPDVHKLLKNRGGFIEDLFRMLQKY